MSLEIKISAFTKIISAQQSIDHAYNFCTFFINRHGVEVVDFHVGIRTNRMAHRSGIFRKLMYTQSVCVRDTLHCSGIQVRGKFLIAENGETFLEAQLKPVTAGNTISRPVVKIFVSNHTLDIVEICVSRSFLRSKDQLGIKNIEPFVFHGSHVEIINCYNHEQIKVILPPETFFIPAHRLFERAHGMIAKFNIFCFNVYLQFNLTSGRCLE